MNLKAFLVGLLAFGLLISPISSIETSAQGRPVVAVEEWKAWEEGKPSQEEFRTVAAPFNQGGEYDFYRVATSLPPASWYKLVPACRGVIPRQAGTGLHLLAKE
ncbi:hypothetical protein PCASD_10499 [Puccinia coronata f. sp. avenae]|uniref:Uncharacterized protein n=1 Tax=Puccinia coronata f. sp. avenae TaxID=200324 RepID=A0A2N5TFF3_9BASI|nr:hypothetical protein PCASD_10499 [Puccinia coronata f. sp. avenae]